MREYQTEKEKILPKDVYMTTLHMIRGYYRRKENLQDMIDEGPDPRQPHVKGGATGSPVESKAMKRERDRDVVAAIDRALKEIPEEYRHGVWQKVMYNAPYPDDAALKTYSNHKATFVILAASYLGLT
ncbi:MAG: hypothetical protein IJ061_06505 [Lachnospiraceae bacterium]|nr:hypothetical protein [Lachnospiraceae bacterium]